MSARPKLHRHTTHATASLVDAEMTKKSISAPLLSEATGINQQTIRRIRHGVREPTVSEFFLICEALGFDPALTYARITAEAVAAAGASAAAAQELDRRLDSIL